MTATLSHSSPARFQLATAVTWAEPWPMYKALRDRDPVHRVVPEDKPDHDYYVMSRHADVWAAARDHETFSSAQGLTINYGELDLIGLADNPPMVMQDPPAHTAFRKLVSRTYSRTFGSTALPRSGSGRPTCLRSTGCSIEHPSRSRPKAWAAPSA